MPNLKSPRVRAVPAVTRAIAILRLLSRSRTPQGLKAIAESLDLVPSTALHIVRALVAEDLLQVDPQTKRYRLGVGMLPPSAPKTAPTPATSRRPSPRTRSAPCSRTVTFRAWCGRSWMNFQAATV